MRLAGTRARTGMVVLSEIAVRGLLRHVVWGKLHFDLADDEFVYLAALSQII